MIGLGFIVAHFGPFGFVVTLGLAVAYFTALRLASKKP